MIPFLSGVVSIAKAIPYLKDLFDEFVKLWISYKIEVIEKEIDGIEAERKAVYNSISKAENDIDRKALSVVLAKLYK